MESYLLIFDLDGTLVDSVEDLTTAVNMTRAEFKLGPVSSSQVAGYVGDGVRMLMVRSIPGMSEAETNRAVALQKACYLAHLCDKTRPYEGVVEGLKSLRDNGHMLVIATNKPVDVTEKLLNGLGLRELFGSVYGGGSVPELKPHPAMIEAAMRRHGFTPEKTWMIGDNHTDLEAARRAGVHSVLMEYGIGDPGPEKPDFIFETFSAFVHHINS